jgi:hypothetical protein
MSRLNFENLHSKLSLLQTQMELESSQETEEVLEDSQDFFEETEKEFTSKKSPFSLFSSSNSKTDLIDAYNKKTDQTKTLTEDILEQLHEEQSSIQRVSENQFEEEQKLQKINERNQYLDNILRVANPVLCAISLLSATTPFGIAAATLQIANQIALETGLWKKAAEYFYPDQEEKQRNFELFVPAGITLFSFAMTGLDLKFSKNSSPILNFLKNKINDWGASLQTFTPFAQISNWVTSILPARAVPAASSSDFFTSCVNVLKKAVTFSQLTLNSVKTYFSYQKASSEKTIENYKHSLSEIERKQSNDLNRLETITQGDSSLFSNTEELNSLKI